MISIFSIIYQALENIFYRVTKRLDFGAFCIFNNSFFDVGECYEALPYALTNYFKPAKDFTICCSLLAVDISLQNATIFVNFPFLLPLLEFFTAPPSEVHHQQQRQVTTASQTSFGTAPVRVPDSAGEDSDWPLQRLESTVSAVARTFSQVDASPSPPHGSQMKISVHGVVKEPDIVLLSDATRRDSEALIVQVSKNKSSRHG